MKVTAQEFFRRVLLVLVKDHFIPSKSEGRKKLYERYPHFESSQPLTLISSDKKIHRVHTFQGHGVVFTFDGDRGRVVGHV